MCAARSAHGPQLDTSASVATKSFDEVFCNINLGITSANRALKLAGSQPKKKKGQEQRGPVGRGCEMQITVVVLSTL